MSGVLSWDECKNSPGTFGSPIAGSNLLAAPWCWRHGSIDEPPTTGVRMREPWHARRSFGSNGATVVIDAFSRRAGGASELLISRAHSAIGQDRIFPGEFPAAASATAPGCRMCFLRRPGDAVPSVVHPPQMLSLVPMEVHGFSASH